MPKPALKLTCYGKHRQPGLRRKGHHPPSRPSAMPAHLTQLDACRRGTSPLCVLAPSASVFELACLGLDSLTPEELASGTHDLQGFGSTKLRLGLALSSIRKLEGKAEPSRGFAAYALQQVGSATALKLKLQGSRHDA